MRPNITSVGLLRLLLALIVFSPVAPAITFRTSHRPDLVDVAETTGTVAPTGGRSQTRVAKGFIGEERRTVIARELPVSFTEQDVWSGTATATVDSDNTANGGSVSAAPATNDGSMWQEQEHPGSIGRPFIAYQGLAVAKESLEEPLAGGSFLGALEEEEEEEGGGRVRCEDYNHLAVVPGVGLDDRELGDAALQGSDGRTPILNIRMLFRHPQVKLFSHLPGPPNISLSSGQALDLRPTECQGGGAAPQQRHQGPDPWDLLDNCGGVFTGVRGVITSPGYPFKYPNNVRCHYRIQVEEDQRVGLVCDDFSLQPGEEDCENDYVLVYSEGSNSTNTTRLCGNAFVDLVSASRELRLVFQTNAAYQYRGFLCRYSALNPDGTSVEELTVSNATEDHNVVCSGPGDSGWSGQCGVNMHRDTSNRIVGGSVVRMYEFPWMVAVLKKCGHDDQHYCHLCGGTVIHYRWILTGAHCIVRVPIDKLGVLLGDHNLYTLTPSQKFFQVERTFIHPRFNVPSPLNNDVALMKLPQTMTFSRYIAPICLPPADVSDFVATLPDMPETDYPTTTELPYYSTSVPLSQPVLHAILAHRNVSMFGWGTIDDAGTIGTSLRGVSVQVLNNQLCDWYYGLMTNTMFCTSGAGGNGPCKGDSGSPAQLQMRDGRWMQVGVLSFGAAVGCETGYPSGNVLLPLFVDWIHFVTGQDFTVFL